jgi:phage gp36-like protein
MAYTDAESFGRNWWQSMGDVDGQRYVTAAVAAAQNVIDLMLGKYYTVPFATTPDTIKTISDMMTRLIVEYMMSKGRLPKIRDIKQGSLLDPIALLEKIASGEYDIPGETRKPATSASLTATVDYVPIFGLDDEIFHEPDPDLLDYLDEQRRS